MRPLVTGQLYCSTQNNANQVATFITNRINTMAGFTLTEPVRAFAWHNNQFIVNFSILCSSIADADSLFDYVVANWTSGGQAARILSTSRIRRTNNYDDEGLGQSDEVIREATKP